MSECEFCLGENWDPGEFDGERHRLSYRDISTGETFSGMACRRCIDFAEQWDDQVDSVIVDWTATA